MKTILIVAATALALAGCGQTRGDRTASGALIGGGTGALIGAAAGGSAGAALAGGLVGAAAGGVIGNATTEPCYVRTRSGRLRAVEC